MPDNGDKKKFKAAGIDDVPRILKVAFETVKAKDKPSKLKTEISDNDEQVGISRSDLNDVVTIKAYPGGIKDMQKKDDKEI